MLNRAIVVLYLGLLQKDNDCRVFGQLPLRLLLLLFLLFSIALYSNFSHSLFVGLQRLGQYPKRQVQVVLVQKATKGQDKKELFMLHLKKVIQLEKKWPMRPQLIRLNAISLGEHIL